MSLLVAAVAEPGIWIVADTAISGVGFDLRARMNSPKVEASQDGMALVGYVGDFDHGSRLIREAATQNAGAGGLKTLQIGHRSCPSVEFAYAFKDASGFHLFRIAGGITQEVQTLHLGSKDAFEHFQHARHDPMIDHAPNAIHKLICAMKGEIDLPDQLGEAIRAMFRVFAERSERDVGGWVVPYALTSEGANFCTYGYTVSDPIADQLPYGSTIPHGSAESGGFGISVSEFGQNEGIVVYWLQKQGGVVLKKRQKGYDLHNFLGRPSEFQAAVFEKLGTKVDIWFGEARLGPLKALQILKDGSGNPTIAIADHGNSLSFSNLSPSGPYSTKVRIPLNDSDLSNSGEIALSSQIQLSIVEDGKGLELRIADPGYGEKTLSLGCEQVDELIRAIARLRMSLSPSVSAEPVTDQNSGDIYVLDPAWRTQLSPHSSMEGVLLKLRHSGFGWVHFWLPKDEALNLGTWLLQNSQQDPSDQAASSAQET